MHATDFVFNGQRASGLGLFIGGIDGDNTTTGGELSLNSVRAPGSDIFVNYSSMFDSPLEFTIPVIKNPCEFPDDYYFDQYEESAIAKWLLQRQGYRWLQFDQEGYEDIYYKVMCTSLTPEQVGGRTVGFIITFTANCGYGFSKEFTKKFDFNSSTNINLRTLNIRNDVDCYINPNVTIIGKGNKITIENKADFQTKTELTLTGSESFFDDNGIEKDGVNMDGENSIINGIISPDAFNYYYLRLIDGDNIFETNSESNISMTIKYREARRVIV